MTCVDDTIPKINYSQPNIPFITIKRYFLSNFITTILTTVHFTTVHEYPLGYNYVLYTTKFINICI